MRTDIFNEEYKMQVLKDEVTETTHKTKPTTQMKNKNKSKYHVIGFPFLSPLCLRLHSDLDLQCTKWCKITWKKWSSYRYSILLKSPELEQCLKFTREKNHIWRKARLT